MALFQRWFKTASSHPSVAEPNAMALSTVDVSTLQPSTRIVLLKGVDDAGFTFFTNYTSRKAAELKANPNAALNFWWPALERQVRIEGAVEKVSAEETQTYFHSRPRASQIGAWASRQSSQISFPGALTERQEALEKRFHGLDVIPVPEFWGGYLLRPKMVEFWQGRESRLHDRIAFLKSQDGSHNGEDWTKTRLCP